MFEGREKWQHSNGTSSRGVVLKGDDELSVEGLDRIFLEHEGASAISEALRDLNGFYAVVHQNEDGIYAAVDRVRSIPLFYGHDREDVYISDDPWYIQEKLGDQTIDERSKREFILTGYVTDDRTLLPNIKQVRSGELIHFYSDDEKGVLLERGYYQHYVPGHYFSGDVEAGLRELEEVLVNVFNRLIKQVKGRTIVVPLSGGYDSKLTVLMLKRLGYKDIIAYSYGRPGNLESNISKSVANALGLRWEFVEYTNERWSELYRSDDYQDYCRYGSGLASTPYIQDFPAVKYLAENRLIPDDSIFVTGHTVAMPVKPMLKGDLKRMEMAIDDVLVRNYNISGQSINDSALLQECREHIADFLGDMSQYEDRHSAYESWDYNNRQSKLLVQVVRNYEYRGFSWWLPLHDKEFVDFWSRMPYEYRFEKTIFKMFVDKLSREYIGEARIPCYQRPMEKRLVESVAELVMKNRRLSNLIAHPFYFIRKRSMYDNHPQAYYGMISRDRFREQYTGREIINYFVALDYIGWLTHTIDGSSSQGT